MSDRYVERSLEPVLRRAAEEFPAVVVTGPRQSGKTTLLKQVFGRTHRYVSLELPDVRTAAAEDPRGFLELYAPPVALGEVQYAPGLLPYVKERIDEARSKCGQYLLTGSQNLLLMERVTESLAGRAAMLRLLPLEREPCQRRDAFAESKHEAEATGSTRPSTPRDNCLPASCRMRGSLACDAARLREANASQGDEGWTTARTSGLMAATRTAGGEMRRDKTGMEVALDLSVAAATETLLQKTSRTFRDRLVVCWEPLFGRAERTKALWCVSPPDDRGRFVLRRADSAALHGIAGWIVPTAAGCTVRVRSVPVWSTAAPFALGTIIAAALLLAACASGRVLLAAGATAGLGAFLLFQRALLAWHRRRDERVLFPLLLEVFDGHVVSVERDVTAD